MAAAQACKSSEHRAYGLVCPCRSFHPVQRRTWRLRARTAAQLQAWQPPSRFAVSAMYEHTLQSSVACASNFIAGVAMAAPGPANLESVRDARGGGWCRRHTRPTTCGAGAAETPNAVVTTKYVTLFKGASAVRLHVGLPVHARLQHAVGYLDPVTMGSCACSASYQHGRRSRL